MRICFRDSNSRAKVRVVFKMQRVVGMNTIRKQYSADGVNWVYFELAGLPQFFERYVAITLNGDVVVSGLRVVNPPRPQGEYALFIFESYYPKGGMDDLVFKGTLEGCMDQVDKWKEANRSVIISGWGFQIVNMTTFTVKLEGGE